MNIEKEIVITALRRGVRAPAVLERLKREVAGARKHATTIGNPSLLAVYQELVKKKKITPSPILAHLLQKRAMRSQSGIVAITVSTKAGGCSKECVYCPNKADMPKSYIASEPAIMRAVRTKWDPFDQVRVRIASLEATGHLAEKIELRILGGTFSAYHKKYQEWFVRRCFDAMNGKTVKTLTSAKKLNERARYRCVGLSLETRPDCCTVSEIAWFRYLGATIIEIGVQTVYDDVQVLTKRGHTCAQVIQATALLKDAGFKIQYHIMPELPGSVPARDIAMMRRLFTGSDYQPDMLKIYPTLVIEGAALYDWWKKGKYKPYSATTRERVLMEMKKLCPPYVRITRLIRDVPSTEIASGNKVTNLRESMIKKLHEQGTPCVCIRCREPREDMSGVADARLFKSSYRASGGTEYFLSLETPDRKTLFSFCRLRIPQERDDARPSTEALQKNLGIKGCAFIRELHTYGVQLGIGEKSSASIQHRGFGKKLMKEAEKIAKKRGYEKMAVIAGVGVRAYYRKLGYRKKGEYMVKGLEGRR